MPLLRCVGIFRRAVGIAIVGLLRTVAAIGQLGADLRRPSRRCALRSAAIGRGYGHQRFRLDWTSRPYCVFESPDSSAQPLEQEYAFTSRHSEERLYV
jgi:hypothetical protein